MNELNTANMLNFMKFSVNMKTHSKVIRILLLHTDIFKIKNGKIKELRNEYESLLRKSQYFDTVKLKYESYKFMELLYGLTEKLKNSEIVSKELDERVKVLVDKLSLENQISICNRLKICRNCECNTNTDSECRIINVQSRTFPAEFLNDRSLQVTEICHNCNAECSVKINFIYPNESIILHFPNGLESFDGTTYVGGSLTAVVECRSRLPFSEYNEGLPEERVYCQLSIDTPGPCRPDFTVHVHKTEGWYQLRDDAPLICHPSPMLTVCRPGDIRYLIFSSPSTSNLYGQEHPQTIMDRLTLSGDSTQDTRITSMDLDAPYKKPYECLTSMDIDMSQKRLPKEVKRRRQFSSIDAGVDLDDEDSWSQVSLSQEPITASSSGMDSSSGISTYSGSSGITLPSRSLHSRMTMSSAKSASTDTAIRKIKKGASQRPPKRPAYSIDHLIQMKRKCLQQQTPPRF